MISCICIHIHIYNLTLFSMSLPYTNEDLVHAHRMNVRIYNIRNNIHYYFQNLIDSTKNAAKLLGASIASCIHGIFPMTFRYTALSVCLNIVENDLIHDKIPNTHNKNHAHAHMHDV